MLKRLFDEIASLTACNKEDIKYMNGNDTTYFDWMINGRLCEFITPHEIVFVHPMVIKIYDRDTWEEREIKVEWLDGIDILKCADELIEYEDTLRVPDFDDVYWNVDIATIEERI